MQSMYELLPTFGAGIEPSDEQFIRFRSAHHVCGKTEATQVALWNNLVLLNLGYQAHERGQVTAETREAASRTS